MAHVRDVQRRPPPLPVRRAPEIKERIDWAASGWAGMIAGAAFILLQAILLTLFAGGPNTDAIRLIASIALGESALPHPPTPFTALVFVAAMAIHLPLSLIYARLLAAIVHGMDLARSVAAGLVFGGALYALNYYAFTNVFPWFAVGRGGITLACHLAFGALAAAVYTSLTSRRR